MRGYKGKKREEEKRLLTIGSKSRARETVWLPEAAVVWCPKP
jgi:hypothetical protein